MEFLDEKAQIHRDVWDKLHISYTDFIRTTHPTHAKFVQEVLEKTLAAGDIYQGEYDWLYCVWCEWFKKEWDLIDHEGKKVCPDHLKTPERVQEKNRFFSLKNFQTKLEEYFASHPEYCLPKHRFNEIISFVTQWLEDFSISREGSDFGIRLPDDFDDPDSVVYIRFDALYNYLTVCLYPQDFTKNWHSVSGEKDDHMFRSEWEVIHTLGKDISRFHAIYRPAMLMSAWYKVSDREIITWFFTVDGQKMSKSLGNSLDPEQLVDEYGRDALVYYLFSDIKIGNDGDFSRERFRSIRENVLSNKWWNLVSRIASQCKKSNLTSVNVSQDMIKQFLGWERREDMSWNLMEDPLWSALNWIELMINKWDYWFTIDDINRWSTKFGQKSILQKNIFFQLFTNKIPWNEITDQINQMLNPDWIYLYLNKRIELVDLTNSLVQGTAPWKDKWENIEIRKYKLSFCLRLIKNLALLSSPFLIEWFARVQEIVQIQDDDWKSFQTTDNEDSLGEKFQRLFELQEFEVEFGEGYVY